MPGTVQHVLSATTPDNTSYEIRPSHWNSGHVVSLALVGSEVVGAFTNSNGVSFGTVPGGQISASVIAQTNQTGALFFQGNTTGQSSSSTYDARSLSISVGGDISVGWSNGSLFFTNAVGDFNGIGVSTAGNTLGNTGLASQQVVLVGGNNITLSQATAAGGLGTITISAGNGGAVQTGISGIVVSNTTYTSGTVTFQNANGISFGSSGANGISASYTVPTQSVQTQNLVDVSLSGNTAGVLALISSGTLVIAGGNNITISQAGQSITISGPNAGGAQTGISSIVVSNTTYTAGQVSFVNTNGISFGSSGAGGISASYTVPAAQSVQTQNLIDVTLSGNTAGALALISSGTMALAGGNNITLSQAGQSVTISAANQSVQTQNLHDVSLSGNTAGVLALVSSGTLVFAGGNNITLSQAGQSITISGANAGGAQTGISGIVVSNTTYTSGTVTFQNANGISFGSSGANGISASYTVPTQSVQTLSAIVSGNTNGNTSAMTFDARSLSLQAFGALTIGLSTTNTGSTILFSSPVQTAQTGLSGIQVSNTTYTSGTVTFQNANGISFGSSGANGISASYTVPTQSVQTQNLVDVSLSGNTAGVLTLVSSGTVIFAGGNNITLSQAGQSITISGANIGGAQTGISGVVVSNTTYTSGTVTFQNANGISFGSSGANGISASYTVPAAQTGISGLVVSNTTYTSGTVTFQNANGISFGSSGANGISASYTVPTQTNQTLSLAATGNTVGNTSGMSVDARSLTLQGLGAVSVGYSTSAGGSSVIVSAPTQTVQTQNLVDVSLSGNTAGVLALVSSGTLIFAGGNNITLSQAGQSITISGPNVGGAQTGISGIVVSNTTYTSGTVTFQNANGISFGSSGANGVSASYTVPSQVSLFALGNTTQNSSTVLPFNALSFNGAGEATIGYSNGSIQISIPPSSFGVSNIGNTLGNTGTFSGQVVLAGGNNITLSVSTVAGGAQTVTISAASQSNQNLSLFALGNTTQNSSSVINASALSFNGLGAMTVGYSNGSAQLSVPATSSLSATGGLSISVNASTISIGQAPVSRYIWPQGDLTVVSAPGQGSVSIQYVPVDGALTATRIDALVGWSGSSTASAVTMAVVISAWAAVFTKNGATLSSLSSGSTQTTYTYASNTAGATALTQSAMRAISVPVNCNFTQGEYYVAFNFSTNSSSIGAATTNLGQTLSIYGDNAIQTAINYADGVSIATATSTNLYGGMGIFTAQTAGIPVSIGLSAINQVSASLSQANIALVFRNI